MFEKPIKKGGLKIIQEPFNINEFNTCIKKMELKKQKYEYKLLKASISLIEYDLGISCLIALVTTWSLINLET